MCDLETIRSQVFFLCYHGKGGFTKDACDTMSLDDLNWNTKRLLDQLDEERKAHEREAAKVRAQGRVRRR